MYILHINIFSLTFICCYLLFINYFFINYINFILNANYIL